MINLTAERNALGGPGAVAAAHPAGGPQQLEPAVAAVLGDGPRGHAPVLGRKLLSCSQSQELSQ